MNPSWLTGNTISYQLIVKSSPFTKFNRLSRAPSVSSRWEARLRAHTARIRQIQAQTGDTEEGMPSSPKGRTNSSADHTPLEESVEADSKSNDRGRHTITEGMVKSESPSLFSRLFRKRAKTRGPIPQYASVRSLRQDSSMAPDVKVPTKGGSMIEISSSPSSLASSTSSLQSEPAIGSTASCTDCVPSPKHKREKKESYLREEKKLDEKEEKNRLKRSR